MLAQLESVNFTILGGGGAVERTNEQTAPSYCLLLLLTACRTVSQQEVFLNKCLFVQYLISGVQRSVFPKQVLCLNVWEI